MPHTKFLGKLIGLFALLVSVSIATHKEDTLATVTAIVQDPATLMVLGFIGLAAGLAMVLSHNVWKGGLLPVLVTLAGWVILIRGVALLALPESVVKNILYMADYRQLFYVYCACAFVFGVYMTAASFKRT